jgi:alpha-galactosidase
LAATSSRLRGEGAARCLGTENASTSSGAGTVIWDCQTAANQVWTTWAGGEVRVFGDKCLQGTTSGTRVTIASCNGQNNQKWTLNANGTVTNTGSGLCLDVNNAGTANGSTVILWTCNGQTNQRWTRV